METYLSKNAKRSAKNLHRKGDSAILELAKANLRHNALLSMAVAAALCLITPLLSGTANLDRATSAMPLEMFLSLVGVALLPPVFQPEQKEEVWDLLSSKAFPMWKIYLIRIAYSIAAMALLIFLFALYMKSNGCDVTPILALGTVADAVFLGSLGMLAAVLANNTVIGYMPPLLYYAMNIGMGARLGKFYLFSMAIGDYGAKLWMLAAGILLMALSLFGQMARRKEVYLRFLYF